MKAADTFNGSDAEPLDVFIVVSCVRTWEAAHGGKRGGRAAYRRNPDIIPIGTVRRATVFWYYEPGIPDALRGTGSPADMADDALTAARIRWLMGDGAHHLHPGEAARARGALRDIGL